MSVAVPPEQTCTVLLVDDDPDSLFLLEHILAQFACQVICVTDGCSALETALTCLPDLILLDIWLPGMSGIEVVRSLRQNQATHSIPVIAVTALASDKDRSLILQAGCDIYVSKPYELEDVEAILERFLKPITDR